jgi:ribonuclease P protein component
MNHFFPIRSVFKKKRKNPERFFNTEMFMMMMIRNKLFFSSAAVAFSSKWLKSIQRERVFSFAQTIAAAMTTMLKT